MGFISFCEELRRATTSNNAKMFQEILFKNSDLLDEPNCISRDKLKSEVKLLLLEATNGDRKIVKMLSNFYQGFELGAKDYLKKNLESALRAGSISTVKSLLKKGVELESIEWGESWKNSLAGAIFKRENINVRKKMLLLLLEHDLDIGYDGHMNFLHQFIHFVDQDDSDAAEIAEILLNSGIPVDEPDNLGYTALFLSIYKSNVPLISLLINRGANIRHYSDWSDTCVIMLADDNAEVLDFLVSNGADLHFKCKDGFTVLHDACHLNMNLKINFLLRMGVDISAQDLSGRTPFSWLQPEMENYDQCVITMLKAFSRLAFENVPIIKYDMDLIEANNKFREHFQKCLEELAKMSSTQFHGPKYSYYSLLCARMGMKKLSNLMKNPELVQKVEENLPKFPYYEDHLREILDEVIQIRDRFETVYLRLNSVFRDFFPDVVLRNLANNIEVEDLPL